VVNLIKETTLLKDHLAKNHLKLTRQRQVILEEFLKADHITAEELHQVLAHQNIHLGLATIYRTLNLLCEIGIGQQRHFGDSKTIYDNVAHKKHHDHLICDKCQKIIEFECPDIERLQEEMAAQHGFTLKNHRLELYGHCMDWENCKDLQEVSRK
jgi:Fur family transcriptional regulator, ferric uptake regulator